MKFVDERARSILSADRQGDGAVRIDVIGTGLGVIFDDEDSRVFPISAGGHRFHIEGLNALSVVPSGQS